MSIETNLNVEIEAEFEALSGIEVGTEAYKTTVDGLTKLLDRAIEIDKHEVEREEKAESRRLEEEHRRKDEEFKLAQMADEKQDRLIRNCLTAAGIVIPTIVTIWGTVKSIEFEKEGTITTIMGRGFVQKLLPKK